MFQGCKCGTVGTGGGYADTAISSHPEYAVAVVVYALFPIAYADMMCSPLYAHSGLPAYPCGHTQRAGYSDLRVPPCQQLVVVPAEPVDTQRHHHCRALPAGVVDVAGLLSARQACDYTGIAQGDGPSGIA